MRTLHIGLRVSDLDRSLTFYRALGYEVLGTVPETEFGSLTLLKLPDEELVSIELVHDGSGDAIAPGGLNHLVIQVEDLRSYAEQRVARDVPVEDVNVLDDTGTFLTAWVSDPDGYRIELVQWPPGHPDGISAADLEDGGG